MEFSDFGLKLSAHSGIGQLMDDIGRPMPEGVRVRPLGGGNPARVSAVEAAYRREMEALLAKDGAFEDFLAHYDSPQGRVSFMESVAQSFRERHGWDITVDNIAVTNGSQSAMFYLFNLFCGHSGTVMRKVLFPLMPEYIGYADQSIEQGSFISVPASCEQLGPHEFKYRLDRAAVEACLEAHPEIGAMAVSRPTNPSGNVLTDEEVSFLSSLAHKYGIPLIIDNAYGLPFPDIIFTSDAHVTWNEDIVLSMSLSKIGLPSIRTGIVIARPEIARALGNMNAVAALATSSFGPVLVDGMIRSGELEELAEKEVRPFYQAKAEEAKSAIERHFAGTDYQLHVIQGSIFCWLYLPSLKIPTLQFYQVLMEEGVVTVPGEYFFFGSDECKDHPHYDKCLRLNYSGDGALVEEGIAVIARLYRQWS